MDMLSRQNVIELLQQRRTALETSIHFLKSLPTEEHPPEPSKHPELVGIWVSLFKSELLEGER
jgi:hypothetical protein